MKKVYSLLIIIMTFSLFLIIFDIYSEREVSDTYNIYGLDDWEATSHIQFTTSIADMDDDVYINKLENLAKKHNVIIISDRIEKDGYNEDFVFYVYPDKNMDELFNLNVTKRKAEKEENTIDRKFYSTNYELNPDYYIHLINPKISVTIHPFSDLKQDSIQKYHPIRIFSHSQESVSDFNADILEEFAFASPDINEMHSHSFDYDEAFRNQIKVFFVLSSVLLCLFMIFNISDEMKKIAIEKMHGFSNGRIALNLFSPIISNTILMQVIATVLSFVFYIHKWNETVLDFMKEYLLALTIINTVFIGILIFVYLIVSFLRLPKLIKNYNFNNMLLNVTFFAKIIFAVMLIPMFSIGLKSLTTSIPYYFEIKKVGEEYNGVLDIYANTMETRFDGYDIAKYIEPGETDEVYDEHVHIYNQLSKTGQMIFQRRSTALLTRAFKEDEKKEKNEGSETKEGIWDASQREYNGFTVDGNYLKKHPIIGQDGKAVDLDLSGDIVYILLPKSIYDENIIEEKYFYTNGNPMKFVIIQDNQDFKDYPFIVYGLSEMEGYQTTPFFELYSDNAFRFDKSIIQHCYLIGFENMEEAKLKLEEIDPKRGYILLPAEERVQRLKNGARQGVLTPILSLLPATGVIIAMNFSVLALYYRSKRKKLSILKVNGYSNVLANADLLIELLLSFIVPVAILYSTYSKNIFLASVYALTIDIICGGIMLFYYRRMKVAL
ncbi:hypothetical protein [Proteiniborus sp. MB09-C3]|uniref:hypothetical protein n=1 Tax=Proteiniborus sp. MB09-C3 TaxID=3050072 RepID=UPI002557B16D|nr:hypothetical protein [Proteiniborus sp. MB09-C3]WIV11496.1 hypothetical protein QO263_15550 [Proteiniborus sp. MB09-C3]